MDNNRVLDYINKMDLHDFENFAAFFFENIYKGTISKHKTIKNALVRDLEGAVRTYKGRILQNHEVKEKLKRDGIEYYEPSLNLVVGRTSTLPHDEWRWLATSNKDIKILTYDNLLTEMSNRLKAHLEFLEYF